MRKTIIGYALAAALMLLPGGGQLFAHNKESGATNMAPVLTKSFSVNRGDRLEVYVDEGDIVVKAWEKNEALVQVSGMDEEEARGVSINQTGKTVRVGYEEQRGRSRHVRFEVSVPSQFDLNLETSGGDVVLQGNFNGQLVGETSGGDIQFGDVQGHVQMSTSGGDITGGKVTGDGKLETSGGDLKVTVVTGEAELDTSGGDITVGDVGKTLKASTAGGDVTVGNVGGRADLSTAGGSIHVGNVDGEARASTAGGDIIMGIVSGSATMRTAGGDLELKGASGVITAKTSGGDVVLHNVTGTVSGETAGGDVTAELIPSGKGDSSLETANGEIALSVPENAHCTIDARIRIRGRWSENKEEYKIYSDFKSQTYNVDEEMHEIHATYTLNGGGERISLDTVNGDIYVRALKR